MREVLEGAVGGALVVLGHADEALEDWATYGGGQVHVAHHLGTEAGHHLAVRPQDGRDHLGHVARAAVGEGGVGVGHLQRRHRRGALAEGHLDVVARVPGGVGEVLRALAVQRLTHRRAVDVAGGLVREVDAGGAGEAELGPHVLDGRVAEAT